MKKKMVILMLMVLGFLLTLIGCNDKKTGWAQTTLSNKKVVAIYLSGDVKTFEEAQESKLFEVVPDKGILTWVVCLFGMKKSNNLCPPGHLIWVEFKDNTGVRLTVHFDQTEKTAFVADPLGGQFESVLLYEIYDATFGIPEDEEDSLGVEIPKGGFK